MSTQSGGDEGVTYCPDCGAMNAKVWVKDKKFCFKCSEMWPEDQLPDESLETLREKYT